MTEHSSNLPDATPHGIASERAIRFGATPLAASLGVAALGVGSLAAHFGASSRHELVPSVVVWTLLGATMPWCVSDLERRRALLVRRFSDMTADDPKPGNLAAPSDPRKRWILFGLFVWITALFVVSSRVVPWTGWPRHLLSLLSVVVVGQMGIVVIIVARLGRIAVQAGRSPVRCSVFAWPRRLVESAYRQYLVALLQGTTLYVLALLTVWLAPSGLWFATQTGPGLGIVLLPALVLISFLLAFHNGLRMILVQCQRRADEELTQQIASAYRSLPDEAADVGLLTLLEARTSIRNESTSPMDFRLLLGTILTLLVPTLEALIRWILI